VVDDGGELGRRIVRLGEIATKHNTDKKPKRHNYTSVYEQYFERMRQKKLRLLELGIGTGASLKMWADYFPNAQIYGADIEKCGRTCLKHSDRIHLFEFDIRVPQSVAGLARQIGEPMDIIIDDCNHASYCQRTAFMLLFPSLLKKPGTYVVEDTFSSYDTTVGKFCPDAGVRSRNNFIEFAKILVDGMHTPFYSHTGRPYELLAVHFYRSMVFLFKGGPIVTGQI
jgi:hypothetical protein